MNDASPTARDPRDLLGRYCIYAKMYGERNSGTNFVENLVQANFAVNVLQSNTRIYDYVETVGPQLPKPMRRAFRSAVMDIESERMLTSDFGWKHGVPPMEQIKSAPHANHTLFVCVAKHPIFWLRSLMARPYNPIEKQPKQFSDFIRHDWQLTGRDNVPGRKTINAVELWNVKNAAFHALAAVAEKCVVAAYEEIVREPAAFLTALDAHLARKRDEFIWSLPSTKGDDMPFEAYREKYDLSTVSSLVPADDLAFIRERIDRGVLAAFGYEL